MSLCPFVLLSPVLTPRPVPATSSLAWCLLSCLVNGGVKHIQPPFVICHTNKQFEREKTKRACDHNDVNLNCIGEPCCPCLSLFHLVCSLSIALGLDQSAIKMDKRKKEKKKMKEKDVGGGCGCLSVSKSEKGKGERGKGKMVTVPSSSSGR